MTKRPGTVVVLGASGMLGSMCERVFRKAGHHVVAIRRGDLGFDACSAAGVDALRQLGPFDTLINCVAITRLAKVDAPILASLLEVNSLLPWRLCEIAQAVGARLLHISTDAVFRGGQEPLFEDSPCDADDLYGLSKRMGEPPAANSLSVRCSIIGPEREPRGHLLGWLLGQADGSVVNGYTDHVWNGVTTLQLARFCRRLAETDLFDGLRQRGAVVHFSPNEPISKFELLAQARHVYKRPIEVRPAVSGRPVTRILQSRHADLIGAAHPVPFSEALAELCAAGSLDNTGQETS